MGDNASLDDFLDGESSEQSEAGDATETVGDAETTAATGDSEPADATETATSAKAETGVDEPDPAAATYAWDGADAPCGDCGEPAERRWQQDGGLVCTECKDWERA